MALQSQRSEDSESDRIAEMEHEIAELTDRASRVEELEEKNIALQDACTELEVALTALYAKSRPSSPVNDPNERSEESRKIENDVLLDYVATRLEKD